MLYTQSTYQLKKGDKVLMEVSASCVEKAQDYFYEEMPEAYSSDYVVTPKPLTVTPSLN